MLRVTGWSGAPRGFGVCPGWTSAQAGVVGPRGARSAGRRGSLWFPLVEGRLCVEPGFDVFEGVRGVDDGVVGEVE